MTSRSRHGGCFRRRSAESGYAYLMAFFMITVVLIGSEAVLRNIAVERRREREAEMIWRGNQYVRAIRLYYRKTGHYPQSMDDLEKGAPDLHFLRPAVLKDPMNRTDGSWRLIYTNASGQIIGSVRYATMQQMALMDLNEGKLPSAVPSSMPGTGVAQDTGTGNAPSTAGSDAQNQSQQPAQSNLTSPPGVLGATSSTNGPGNALANPFSASATTGPPLQPTGPVDGPVLGAFLAGVAGGNHYNGDSVKTYKGGKTYQQWEFIWNPLEDQARALQNGLSPQTGSGQQTGGLPGLPIAMPNGGAPAASPNPPSGTPQSAPEQPQQPQQPPQP
ncbi:MAG TPA: hypothetical protein VEJ45_03250 [Candidatus Acidoferrales bacterium]|nr:hypothetical protein [Candidatus Acidoferrales bacterium]